jgi:hypothetical protein
MNNSKHELKYISVMALLGILAIGILVTSGIQQANTAPPFFLIFFFPTLLFIEANSTVA